MQTSKNLFGCQVYEPDDAPRGWDCVPLGERIVLEYGRGLREGDRRKGLVPVFGSNGQVGSHDAALCRGPGILVGRKGTVGAVHYTEQSFWAIDTVYYVVLLSDDDLQYVYYLLQYLPLKNLNAATGVPGLSRRDAYALRGVFPPKPEQIVIAKTLTRVDATIALVAGTAGLKLAQAPLFQIAADKPTTTRPDNRLAALVEIRKSLMHDLLSGRVRVQQRQLQRAVQS
jgi:restriction endonuclease S subunit